MEPVSSIAVLDADVYYPDTDGEPAAEGDIQLTYLLYCREALRLWFSASSDVYVTGNLLFYYEKGNPKKSFAPDVGVVFGVPNHERPSYKIWEEGKAPEVIIEITSRSTRRTDMNFKKGLYRDLGVSEYYLYDPCGDYLRPQLKAFSLDEIGLYIDVRPVVIASDAFMVYSPTLDLELRVEGGRLRLFDRESGHYLLSTKELDELATAQAEARFDAERRAEAAERKAEAAERTIAALMQELETLKDRESGVRSEL
ncbi:MAG: Uma2 family endonuclease [Pseudomonadota bacterium]